MAIILINLGLILLFPLLLSGIIRRIKSIWGGRKGPKVTQPFYDIFKLLKKGVVISHTVSPWFQMVPSISLAAVIAAAIVMPMAGKQAILSFNGDFIVFCYLLALSKFFLVIGGMDTGSSFEGMGCSRELTFSALAEPGFFMIMAALSWVAGVKSFDEIGQIIYQQGSGTGLLIILAGIGLFLFLLVECGRMPVDDQETHLELTMIHEVMILDNSGPDLAFLSYTAALKMYLIIALMSVLMVPPGMSIIAATGCFAAIAIAIAVLIGLVESVTARLRMTHVPQFAFLIIALGMIIVFIVLMQNGRPL